MQLYEYQVNAINNAISILKENGIVYLAMGMRTGKTLVSLSIAKTLGCESVLVLVPNEPTKNNFIKTAASIEFTGVLDVSSHHPITIEKFKNKKYDCIIVDEAHNFKAFPRTNARQKSLRDIALFNKNAYKILLSGTPSPESYSDLYHQLWAVGRETHKNFYAFAREYVRVKEKRVAGGMVVKDYSECSEKYYDKLEHLFVVVSQEQAGILTNKVFKYKRCATNINAHLHQLLTRGAVTIDGEVFEAPTIAREMQMIRQLCGGFIYRADGSFRLVDTAKIKALQEVMNEYKKILIYYYYDAERTILLENFRDILTENLDLSKKSSMHYLAQMTSKREGITFPEAEAIVYFNVDFSAITYLQSIERASLHSKERVDIVYLISEGYEGFKGLSFEEIVLKTLRNKKRFTEKVYEKFRQV